MRIALLSNVVMELLAKSLSHDVYLPGGYDTWQLAILDENSVFNREAFAAVFVILHCKDAKKHWDADGGTEALEQWLGVLEAAAASKPGTNFFIANLDIAVDVIRPVCAPQPEREWEYHWQAGIDALGREHPNVYRFDLKTMVEELGRDAFYSPKMWYAAGMPYSLKAIRLLAGEIERSSADIRKKVLVTDLDNTLWGGVAGEDGPEGIVLSESQEGARYHDFQLRLKELEQTGALLAVVSKNNAADVDPILNSHPYMALKPADFAAAKINWDDKAENIRALAEELNLGLDSMVFIDDNPLERERIRQELPEVEVVDFPSDTALLEKTALEVYRRHFRVLRATAEDTRKTQLYRQEGERRALRKTAATSADYIRALEIEVTVRRMTASEIDRVVQLCNKTNQFNLTTKRYRMQEIFALADSVLTVRGRDKYGDNGLVGVMILKEYETPEARGVEIDTFLLSCRVMGRMIEDHIFWAVAARCRSRGFAEIRGVFISTAKNKPVERLYDRLGFTVIAQTPERTEYVYDLSQAAGEGNDLYPCRWMEEINE